MKKLLLSLGAIASVAAPVAAVVACGSTTPGATDKALVSSMTQTELSAVDTDQLAGKTVGDLDTAFGITTGIEKTESLEGPVTLILNTLTFKSGDVADATTHTFKITPKSEADVDLQIAKTSAKTTLKGLGLSHSILTRAIEAINGAKTVDEVNSILSAKTPVKAVEIVKGSLTESFDADGNVVIVISPKTNDFEHHMASDAIRKLSNDINPANDKTEVEIETKLNAIKTITVVLEGDAKAVSVKVNLAAKTGDVIEQTVTKAINHAVEKDLEAGVISNELSSKDSNYESEMVSRINALTIVNGDWEDANKILEAVGNSGRWMSADQVKPGLSAKSAKLVGDKAKVQTVTREFVIADNHNDAIKAALNAKLSKLND